MLTGVSSCWSVEIASYQATAGWQLGCDPSNHRRSQDAEGRADVKFGATLAATVLTENPSLRLAAETSTLLQTLRDKSRRIELDGTAYYVVEGDLLYDEDELALYALQWDARANAAEVGNPTEVGDPASLSINTTNGKIVRWPPGQMLRYTVVEGSFPTKRDYDGVVAWMRVASDGWSALCGVEFEHVGAHDAVDISTVAAPSDIAADLVFGVRYAADLGVQVLASAFFPTYEPTRRWIRVGPGLLSSAAAEPVGVLRHELGHVLGFRHEHILPDAPPACPDEPLAEVLPVTEYDPRSVMHYPCTAVADRVELEFTELDRQGAQRVYGPPLSAFAFVS
jgi:hypothetical protein